jgi:FkbM family methyltransferase
MIEKIIQFYVVIFGRLFFLNLNKFLFMISLRGMGILNYKNSLVSGEKYFLENYLKDKKGVVFDVGANVGNYSEEVIGINESVSVFAFEPHPITFKKLQNKFHQNKKVKVINKGLASKSGELELFDYFDKDGSTHASLFKEVITGIHGTTNAVAHKVALVTIDDFVIKESIHEILLLKIDTEGNELDVLKGAKKILSEKKVLAIHFEFNEMNVVSRTLFKDFWNLLDASRYNFYRLLPNGMIQIKFYSPLICEIMAYQNIVAILKK